MQKMKNIHFKGLNKKIRMERKMKDSGNDNENEICSLDKIMVSTEKAVEFCWGL